MRDQLRVTLNGGEAGWNYDEPAVVEAVCWGRCPQVELRLKMPDGHAQAIVADPRSQTDPDASGRLVGAYEEGDELLTATVTASALSEERLNGPPVLVLAG